MITYMRKLKRKKERKKKESSLDAIQGYKASPCPGRCTEASQRMELWDCGSGSIW